MQKDLNVLKNPLTLEEIKSKLEKDSTYVTGVVEVGLRFIIDNDLEGLLDELSERLIGTSTLMDISYKVVGVGSDGSTLFIEVTGDASEMLGNKKDPSLADVSF